MNGIGEIQPEVPYIGRFAPSPTGPLHLGSLVAAMASWLDARVHRGIWLVRIEDLDPPREMAGASAHILETLRAFGFEWSGEPMVQSRRGAEYQRAFDDLKRDSRVYPCGCTRKEIAASSLVSLAGEPGGGCALVYPGTCRNGLASGRSPRAWRMRIDNPAGVSREAPDGGLQMSGKLRFVDRWFGPIEQNLATEVGDFVLKRADGLWAYQLAVVVDDAAQGVTDVVRGADLLDSTPRQILLQHALGFATPRYLHVPVVLSESGSHKGEKLSKQTGAAALDRLRPLAELRAAARHLGLPEPDTTQIQEFWRQATLSWVALNWQRGEKNPE